MASDVEYLEMLCKQLYESTDPLQRATAEKTLLEFSESTDCLQKCSILLERGTSPYAQVVAGTTLTKLISKASPVVSLQDRIELRNYLLSYLVTRQKLPQFVINSLCQLFARLTKLGWFDYGDIGSPVKEEDNFVFRTSVEEIIKLSQGSSVELCILGVQLLAELVTEMNQVTGIGSISKHRKIASSFRDANLFDVFELSVRLCQFAYDNLKLMSDKALLGHVLRLAQQCLTFDFIGSVSDDTSDDNVSLQVPTSWRIIFVESNILKLFFGLYASLPADLASIALSCLVQLASVRRTIFNNSERQDYLTALVLGVKQILENPQGLSDQNTYHEFCRLIARLKCNYQLGELLKVDDYQKVLRAITEFTVTSLQMYQFAANSIHYLLSFWQRMVSSMPYVKGSEQHFIETCAPLVTKAYIETRLALVAVVASEGIDNPLDDHSSLGQQLEQVSVIGRCEYEKTCQLLIQLFDQSGGLFQQASASNNQLELTVHEGRLTWLVFIIGAVIGGRVSFNTSDEHDEVDGDLICRSLELMRCTDNRLPQRGSEKLELAYLWFLEQFRKIYISDQVQKVSKVYNKLSEILGLNEEAAVLAVFVRKIITNLKFWSSVERIVDETLTLLNDLSIGYSSVRKLVRLPEIQFLMNNHTNEHFSFLGTQAALRTMKCRTTFYTALTRLLCVEISDEEEEFERFLAPITSAFNELVKVFTLPSTSLATQTEAKMAVIGLSRDVRGVAFASNTKTAYMTLFNWLYPNYFAIFQKALELWYMDPNLTSPVLKLMTELCQNRSQRLLCDVTSPNAFLLFKEASKMICTYGSNILAVGDIPKEQLYNLRLKGTGICFSMLKAALNGGYVNFGVFRLYGDSCLDDALSVFVKLLLAVPQTDLLAYAKLSQHYYLLVETLSQDHLPFFSGLEPNVFAFILQTLHEGLTALDTMVCTGCCSTLDFIVTYLYKRVCRVGKPQKSHIGLVPESDNCLKTLEMHAGIFRQMLTAIMQVLVFDDCRNQWSMSRPLLGLILLNEEHFNQLKMQIIASQAVAKQQTLAQCFDALMDGVERNLSMRNKDKFTQNLTGFRRDVTECLKGNQNGAIVTATSSDYLM